MRMKEKHDLIAKDLELDPINAEGCDGSVALGKLLVGSKVIGVTTVNDVSQDIVVCDGVLLYIKHGRKKNHLKICADFEGNLLGISKTKIDRNILTKGESADESSSVRSCSKSQTDIRDNRKMHTQWKKECYFTGGVN